MKKNPINIDVLEVIDAIDRRQSFAKAAEELNKAPSAISYAIQKLEEQLGVTIFERQGRRSVLTPSGLLVLNEGRKILANTHRLADTVKQVATGWETSLRIAVESVYPYPSFFSVLHAFLVEYSSIEIDVIESVLNGGWEALENDQIDLLVGAPGPVPLQRGFRAVPLNNTDLILVISPRHPKFEYALDGTSLNTLLPTVRRIITHDTSNTQISRSAGLTDSGNVFYVQNINQKIEAIVAGIGVGHLPKHAIHSQLNAGELVELSFNNTENQPCYMAWKINNKGQGLKRLTTMIEQLK